MHSGTLATSDKVLIYSDTDRIILQLRRQFPSEEQLLEPSFKVAVFLTAAEAITIASDLLNAALPQLAALQSVALAGAEIRNLMLILTAIMVLESLSSILWCAL